jgi:chromosomal replication initiator protein
MRTASPEAIASLTPTTPALTAGAEAPKRAINLAPRTSASTIDTSPAALRQRVREHVGSEQFARFFDDDITLSVEQRVLTVSGPSGSMLGVVERRFGNVLLAVLDCVKLVTRVAPKSSKPAAASDAQANHGLNQGHNHGHNHGQNGSASGMTSPGTMGSPHALSSGARAIATRVPGQAATGLSGSGLSRPVAQPHGLSDFLVGESNRVAYLTVLRVAEDPAQRGAVFVHGPCGVGKTHLLRGVQQRYMQVYPHGKTKYFTGETFTNEFITAVRAGKLDAFRKQVRGLDLLCLDDVHFLSNKEGTQNELLHTFDTLGLSNAKVLMASDEHPQQIEAFSQRLLSRCMGGPVVGISPPDPVLRRQLIQRLASKRGLLLDEHAIQMLAERSARAVGSLGGFGGSVREIEGLLNQIEAVYRLLPGEGHATHSTIGCTVVARALGLEGRGNGSTISGVAGGLNRPLSAAAIVDQVCLALAVEKRDFEGTGRHKRVVLARELVSYLARELTTQSYPEIARAMGRDNHSTIIAAQRRLKHLLETQGDDPSVLPLEALPMAMRAHLGGSLREVVSTLMGRMREK